MRAWIAVALLVSLVLAGCASKEKNDPGSDGTGDGAGTQSGSKTGTSSSTKTGSSGTGSGTPGPNRGPVISITLAANQSANGSAPLSLTFVLNGTDADGDALAWTLSFADGTANATGASLPAQQNHTFAAAGNYSVVFNVTDGKTSVNATYPILVASGAPSDLAPIVVSGMWLVGTPDGGSYELQTCEAGPGDGVTTAFFELPAEAGGRPFTATIAGTGAIVSWWVFLTNPGCGTGATDYDTFTVDGSGPITGTVLAGWTLGAFASSGGAQLKATITIT